MYPGLAEHREGTLRLLQDICSASGELPSKYFLNGIEVKWWPSIARGGEATIYRGTIGTQAVVVREICAPNDGGWASQSGTRVIEVLLFHAFASTRVEQLAQVHQT